MKEIKKYAQIVNGKRKRVMSMNGVMSVVTKELLREQKIPQPQVLKTVVKKQEKKKQKIIVKQQLKNDKRVRITKSALKELVQTHFIVVDDNEDAMIQSSKYFKNQLVENEKKGSSSSESQSDSSSSSSF